jgi:DNA replication ATP-dependent helicase Dna2
MPAQEFEAASSEDEFDDDFDLDAIEQTMKEAGQDADNVCYS